MAKKKEDSAEEAEKNKSIGSLNDRKAIAAGPKSPS